MRFHSNQLSWVINYPFISLCFKYHSPGFICFSTMLAPIFSSLDGIYCTFECSLIIKTQNGLMEDEYDPFFVQRTTMDGRVWPVPEGLVNTK